MEEYLWYPIYSLTPVKQPIIHIRPTLRYPTNQPTNPARAWHYCFDGGSCTGTHSMIWYPPSVNAVIWNVQEASFHIWHLQNFPSNGESEKSNASYFIILVKQPIIYIRPTIPLPNQPTNQPIQGMLLSFRCIRPYPPSVNAVISNNNRNNLHS